MDFGFLRIAAAIPSVQVAGCRHNVSRIEKLIRQAAGRQAALVAFPELAVTDILAETFSPNARCSTERKAHWPIC